MEMKKSSLKSKALITAISALGVTGTAAVTAQAKSYTVKSGDTLWSLANDNNTSVNALASENKISDPNLIITGDTLVLPDDDATTTPAQKTAESSAASSSTSQASSSTSVASGNYTVQAGDSLWSIAQKTGADVNQLVANNGGKSLIQIGQIIQISTSTTSSAASDSVNDVASSSASVASSSVAVSSVAAESDSSSASVVSSSAVVSSVASVSNSSAAVSSSPSSASVVSSSVVVSSVASAASSSASAAVSSASSVASSSASVTSSYFAAASAAAKAASTSSLSKTNVTTTTASQVSQTSTTSTSTAQAVVNLAIQLSKENIPYVWGGSTTAGFDCSGLVSYVYQHAAGITLPHYTVSQESYVSKHSVSQAKPGDLLFWGSAGATYHVAIYIGNNQYVAAPEPGMNVEVETISSYFMPSFAGTVIK
ncbi:peptidoglycan-binding protein [Oenococcus oeni]|uniref:LysM peptidoglycan-binding domain-containing C40 family peptidase n=2 Tax=Oenococcus oeni TaxID=1247 RepID=UPI0004ABEFC4|nr:LysM peptidoglycan-binding domain-containing C40 family peptidase [Oenococcus oeni]KEP88330.1 peptidoglycan-binding protein [Oenococcus oeni IOEB_0501]OIL35847.1 peptidoglycan-binding protein [Oenococcus oeni]OIM35769.1 peptidoglycan-binding protein [Oenococcus oeni]OIM60261.1 peptidoglycan-binding protein [Oenococcus oeni]OLQ31366.1 peptidoglycan-binding protein [Oenococcus oeni]